MDGRARFANLANEHLNDLPDGIFRQMMLAELAKRAQINHLAPLAKGKKITRAIPANLKARSPSTLRLAIILLIQQPSLAEHLTEPLPSLDIRGYELFCEIIELARKMPGLSTAGVCEHWRDRPESEIITKLAYTQHMVPESGMTEEFLGAVKQLRKLGHEQLIKQILAKASQTELTAAEKQELHELISSNK